MVGIRVRGRGRTRRKVSRLEREESEAGVMQEGNEVGTEPLWHQSELALNCVVLGGSREECCGEELLRKS